MGDEDLNFGSELITAGISYTGVPAQKSSIKEMATVANIANLESTAEEMECPYCLDGDVPTEEVLPNDEHIMAHWVNGICRECKDFQ